MEYLSGFVAILGSPNVGKSTLMNKLIGSKVAIVTKKAQTTRNKVVGILTRRDYQIVFLDTPGLHTPKNKLGDYMVKTAYDASRDVDLILLVLDAVRGLGERDRQILEKLQSEPVFVVINKKDAASQERLEGIKGQLTELGIEPAQMMCISAIQEEGLEELEQEIKGHLLPGPQFYPEDMITDRPERFIAGELIREKALLHLREEIPHGIGVDIEKVEEEENLTKVYAVIYCERDAHKGMIIGKGGAMLKKIGQDARADLEMLFGTKVFLQLWVKVKKDWRNSPSMLKELGYQD